MEKNNAGKEIKNNSRKLYALITEEIRDIGNYITILTRLEAKRWHSNDEKARALYKELYVKTGRLKIKRAFSELEIKKFIDSHDSILKLIRQLSTLLREIEKAQKKIKKWSGFGDSFVDLINLVGAAEANKKKRNDTVNEIIDDFMEAKEHLNTVCKLAKRMNSENVPVVKEIIDAYLDFFVKANAICMTVARYARNINREAEKTLGHKSNLQKTIGGNNKNTYLYMQKTLAEE